jgi:hypothetical protein
MVIMPKRTAIEEELHVQFQSDGVQIVRVMPSVESGRRLATQKGISIRHVTGTHWILDQFHIVPEAKRAGFGGRTLAAVFKFLQGPTVRCTRLCVTNPTTSGKAFYVHLGATRQVGDLVWFTAVMNQKIAEYSTEQQQQQQQQQPEPAQPADVIAAGSEMAAAAASAASASAAAAAQQQQPQQFSQYELALETGANLLPRSCRGGNLFNKNIVLGFPVNISNTHWVAVEIITAERIIKVYDSCLGNPEAYHYATAHEDIHRLLSDFLRVHWQCAYPCKPAPVFKLVVDPDAEQQAPLQITARL